MRRIPANFLITIGLLAAFLAYTGYSLDRTIFDANAVSHASQQILDAPAVRTEFVNRVITAIGDQVPNATTAQQTQINQVSRQAVGDPAFVQAFSQSIGQLHRIVFGNEKAAVTLDTTAVGTAVHDAALNIDPTLAAQIPVTGLSVTISSTDLPNLHAIPNAVIALGWFFGAVALVALLIALAVHPDRALAFTKIGVWAVVIGGTQLLLFWVLPHLVLDHAGTWGEVLGAVLQSTGEGFVRGALGVLIGAAVCFAVASGIRHQRRNVRRKARSVAFDR